jgi:hypothetical protein
MISKVKIIFILMALALSSCYSTYKVGANYHTAKVHRADVHKNGGCAWDK